MIHAEAVRVRRGACARPRVWQAASEKGGLFKAEPFESYESSYSFSKDQRETKKKHFFLLALELSDYQENTLSCYFRTHNKT